MKKRELKLTKEHLRTPEGTAVIAALIYGFFTHLYAFNNILHNHDNIASQPGGYGSGVPLGRWLLELAGLFMDKLGLNYNLSVVNGVVYVCLIALAAGVLVSVLKIRKRTSAALIGMLMVAFPTVSATMVYRYTVMFYGFSALFAILAVWVFSRVKYGFVWSVLCIMLSMGLYQAYVPLTIGLFVLVLIRQALEGKTDALTLIRRGLCCCAALALGLVLYFAGQKLCELYFGIQLTDYQGVSSMGNLQLADIPRLVVEAFTTFCSIVVRDYCGIANRAMMRIAYLLLMVLSIGMVAVILVVKVRKASVALVTVLLCLVFPVAVNFIAIMCPDGWIYSLMVYAFVLVACMPLVLLECMPEWDGTLWKRAKPLLAKGVGVLTALLVVYYGYYANVNYTTLHYANRQIENYLSSMVVQVRMTEGYTAQTKWAFIGDIDDPLFQSPWQDEVIYGGSGYTQYLMNQYSRPNWFQNYIGYTLPMAEEETVAALAASAQVQAMPCFPDNGSIKVIGDTVVIKCQD